MPKTPTKKPKNLLQQMPLRKLARELKKKLLKELEEKSAQAESRKPKKT